MEFRQGQTDDYLPPLPPRPSKQNKNFCENVQNLWTKIPQQLQPIVKVSLIVLGCILALIIAFLIGYDTAKSKYQVKTRKPDSSEVQIPDYNSEEVLSGSCDRNLAYPSDCSKYYQCVNGEPQLSSCSSHHHFDPVKNSCVWIHLSSCGKDAGSLPPSHGAGGDTSSDGTGSLPPTLEIVKAQELKMTSQGEISILKKRLATLPSVQVELVRPGRAANPANTKLVESIIKEKDWEFLFPQRHSAYTYTNFLKAIAKFPAVCHPDSEATCRKVLATMFAHFTQETGGHNPSGGVPQWRQGLHYVEELGCDARDCGYSTNCAGGEWTAKAWPCGKLDSGEYQHYHGRGAKQLSYNYNYGQFSAAMYGDIRYLLDNPDLVRDTWLNLASAIWFFATPQPPKPSMLGVIEGDWTPSGTDKIRGLRLGFGLTTNIINGGIECGKGSETQQARNRGEYYKEFAAYLNVQVVGDLGCGRMKPFADGGSTGVYWEQDWSNNYQCKLVTYQTAYSALVPGDYVRCVRDKFKLDI